MITIKNEKAYNQKLKRFAKKTGKQFDMVLTDATNKMHRKAVNDAPVDNGDLRQNIRISGKGVVISHKTYSEAVEKGTKPHTIRAKDAKVLAGAARKAPSGWNNFSRDWAIYGKEVRHPGTKGQPFMRPAWEHGRNVLNREIKKVL